MLSSTSSSRLTSSMRATRRSVVRPRLSREAHSSATPAFLEVFTSMLPESLVGTGDTQVRRSGAELDDGPVESLADALDHLQGEVLVASLDPVDRTLAGAELVGQLLLGPAAVLACIADQGPDAVHVVMTHPITVSQI